MKVDERFLTAEGPEIFTGNELLIKGALETEGGVHLLGGYPGSPIAEFFDKLPQIKELLIAHGIRAVMNNNEALAAAMLNGSQVIGARGLIAMKSVGVHVAADALALGNLAGAHREGGAVVIYGDDPWCDSTQVPADSRFLSRHLYIPVIEPSNAQEVKDFVDLAFRLSRESELYAGFVVTTSLADGGGTVCCRPNRYPAFNMRQRLTLNTAELDLNKFVLLPPRTWWQEASLASRHQRAVEAARRLGLNRVFYGGSEPRELGFVTSGLAHAYLLQALLELGLLGQHPILKFGMSYPIDAELVAQFARQCRRIIVVEERRGFLQEQIAQIVLGLRQQGRAEGDVEVWGKSFPLGLRGLPETRGLHPSILIERLAPLLSRLQDRGSPRRRPSPQCEALRKELETVETTAQVEVGPLPARQATFCPGCPHRDTASVCLEIRRRFMDESYMKAVHGRGPIDLVFHGDTGCYTMLMYPPNTSLMHNYSGMGLGGGTGSGIDPFVTNKQVVFMGDSTFFHSGQIAISQAIKLCQDITFVILDNRTTGMTGHQPTPGLEYDVLGDPTPAQRIDEVVRGMATETDIPVVRVDVERRKEYARLLEQTFLADGVKVIVADKECGITRNRRRRREQRSVSRRQGFLPAWGHMNVNPEVCRFCLACTEITGCPGLKHVETDYGPKMDTDITWCVDDGCCERLGACSAFERVIIRRKKPPRSRVPELGLDDIPEPARRQPGELWRCCLAGFGGMGIGLATSILVRAGHKEGYEVSFVDKKGLAIRNGGVVSQVLYNLSRQPITPVIPFGKADLLIGLDVLEAARAIDGRGRMRVASKGRTAAVINTDKIDTILGLMAQEGFDPDQLEALIRRHTRDDDCLARNISRICEKYLGSKLYANMMMLGFAFQKGLIPVSMHSMAWAIKDAVRTDVRKNMYAFNMGRKLVVQPDLFQGPPQRTDWRDLLEDKCRCVIRRHGRQHLADELRQLAAEAVAAVAALDDRLKRALVVRIYDCLRWGGLEYACRYARQVASVFARDKSERDFAATQAVIFNLAAAMLIKDGVFLAELSASPEKHARDRDKYNVNPANGDRILYRHLWNWTWRLGGRRLDLEMTLYPWMLRLLRASRYLRRALPLWHRRERQFLSRYEQAVADFSSASPEHYSQALAALSSPPCMDCLQPRCQEAGCPLHSDVPRWIDLAAQGRWREAADLLHEHNNFPEFTGRICPAPCQEQCKQRLSGYPVEVRWIEQEIVERAWREGWVEAQPAAKKSGKQVAIVGSGPAGLAAAQQLARAGHAVVVFEKDDAPGGLLRHGIPSFRLDKRLLDRRLAQLRREGVEFRCGALIGVDVPGDRLRQEFDAVLLAVGTPRPRALNVPGADLPGVHYALDFLRACERGASVAGETAATRGTPVLPVLPLRGKIVAVIGGGLTGDDCVEAALAEGAKQVVQFEIMPNAAAPPARREPPVGPVRKEYCVATRELSAENGRLAGLRAVRVAWSGGREPKPRELPETEFFAPADVAVVAIGFDAVLDPALAAQLGIEPDARGRVVTRKCATTAAGVFAAGDIVIGASQVARAIAAGREAAAAIDEFLCKTAATPA